MTRRRGPEPGIYEWRGRRYVGQRAVADAAGVSAKAVNYHLYTYGNLDRLGKGSGNHEGDRSARNIPVTVGARRFESIRGFARQVGVSPTTASRLVRTGQRSKLLEAVMAADARGSAQ